MKTKEKKDKILKLSNSERKTLVALSEKLKGKDLFPQSTEEARNYLKKTKFCAKF